MRTIKSILKDSRTFRTQDDFIGNGFMLLNKKYAPDAYIKAFNSIDNENTFIVNHDFNISFKMNDPVDIDKSKLEVIESDLFKNQYIYLIKNAKRQYATLTVNKEYMDYFIKNKFDFKADQPLGSQVLSYIFICKNDEIVGLIMPKRIDDDAVETAITILTEKSA